MRKLVLATCLWLLAAIPAHAVVDVDAVNGLFRAIDRAMTAQDAEKVMRYMSDSISVVRNNTTFRGNERRTMGRVSFRQYLLDLFEDSWRYRQRTRLQALRWENGYPVAEANIREQMTDQDGRTEAVDVQTRVELRVERGRLVIYRIVNIATDATVK
jgi:hypothetical protein